MIIGIGTDISENSRFLGWYEKQSGIYRFFNEKEILDVNKFSESIRKQTFCEYYAVRFAAKEAFGKALGTGLSGFELKEVYIVNDDNGKPELHVEGRALRLLEEKAGAGSTVHVSLSHEKEYSLAFVVIEK